MSQNDHGDPDDLMPRLEATQDLSDGGVPFGEISARALTVGDEAKALIEAIRSDNEWRRQHNAPAHPVEQPLTEWIRSVEARLSALRADRDRLRELVAAREDEIDFWRAEATQKSTTERGGQALAEQQAAPQPDACSRCGKPLKVNGRLRSCERCSTSWMVPEKREPLAQSPWVPDDAPAGQAEWQPTYKDWLQERDNAVARADERDVYARRVRELEVEVDRLKAANATLAPAERSDNGQLVVLRVRALMTMASMRSPDVVFEAAQLLRALSDCNKADRIEFSVKEVLP